MHTDMTLAPSAFDADEWRQQSKALAQTVAFSLDRMYLDASTQSLAKHLRFMPETEPALPTRWLRVETVGDPQQERFDAATALRIALETCHRPAQSRLYFLVQSDGEVAEVLLGLRGTGMHGDSDTHAESAKSFLESAWQGTKLAVVPDGSATQARLDEMLHSPAGRFVITGVPRPQSRDGGAPCGLECLLDGLAGKRFAFLVIADPMPPAEREDLLGHARDLLGALRTMQELSLTQSASRAVSSTRSVTETKSSSFAELAGSSTSGKKHSKLHKLTDFVTAGAAGLAPLYPPLGLAAAMSYLVGQVLPRDLTDAQSQSQTTTTGTSKAVAEGTGTTQTDGAAIAQKYASAHLEAVSASLKGMLDRVQERKMWKVGTYLIAETDEDAHDAASQLAALLNGPRLAGEEAVRFKSLQPFWKGGVAAALRAGCRPRFEIAAGEAGGSVAHPLGESFEGLSTPLTSDELALLCALPRREVPGIRVRPSAKFGINPPRIEGRGIRIGNVLRADQPLPSALSVTLESLTRNTLITGTVGSGKTNTVKHILAQLLQAGVPFLVIEPAKSEYLDWAREINAALPEDSAHRIAVYAPGAGRCEPGDRDLHLNPFHVHAPDLVTMHIERLKTLLVGSLPMQEAMPMLLESVLYATYRHNGWFAGGADATIAPRFPTVSGTLCSKSRAENRIPRDKSSHPHADTMLASVVLEKGYDERVSSSFIGALRTRLEFLCEKGSWKREVFDCPQSTPPQELFLRPAVVNLSNLHADRPFAAGLLLSYLHEFRRAESEGKAPAGLRHLTVLEEAHCLLEPSRHVGAESMDPKGMLSAMCSEMLSEMRAWGEGFMLVDQYPTRLIPDAVKNTNLKIVHRLPARDDQDTIAAAMSLSKSQTQIIPFLLTGQAIVSGHDDDAPLRVQVPLARRAAS